MDKAPFFSDICDVGGLDKGLHCQWARAVDGRRLRIAVWNKGADKSVLIIQGRTEYMEKYDGVVGQWLARGYNVLTYDVRGQGLSARAFALPIIGHVKSFGEYQLDIDAVLDVAMDLGVAFPKTLLCHSMGGAIGLRALHRNPRFERVIFSAPMWGIEMPRLQRFVFQPLSLLMWAFGQAHQRTPSTLTRNYVFTAPFEDNILTTNRAEYDKIKQQLLARPQLEIAGPSMAWLRAALKETHGLRRLPPPDRPCLCLLGGQEQVVDSQAIRDKMGLWGDGELAFYEGARHEVLFETPRIVEDVWGRIDKFCGH